VKLPDTALLNPNVPRHRGYSGRLKAVILDWAGTTVDYGSLAPVRTLQQVFERAGLPISEPEARRDMGIQKKDHIRAILTIPRVREAWTQSHGHPATETDVEALYQQFIPLQFSCLLEYSTVLSGIPEAVERFRRRGLKIGTSTGYTREMLDMLVSASAKAGYHADCNLCPDDVSAGRPHPYMIFENAVRLQVYPLAAVVKVGDTPSDIQEGLNAGTWTVGVAATGNMNGLSREEFSLLSPAEQEACLATARAELQKAGAHFVIDSVAEADPVLDEIDTHLQSADPSTSASAAAPR
jgi:phosphonoacetaldehyde hydrolase